MEDGYTKWSYKEYVLNKSVNNFRFTIVSHLMVNELYYDIVGLLTVFLSATLINISWSCLWCLHYLSEVQVKVSKDKEMGVSSFWLIIYIILMSIRNHITGPVQVNIMIKWHWIDFSFINVCAEYVDSTHLVSLFIHWICTLKTRTTTKNDINHCCIAQHYFLIQK